MSDDRPLAWLALGVALASQPMRSRLVAMVAPGEWEGVKGRLVLENLSKGRSRLLTALAGLGIYLGPGQLAADAILDALDEWAKKRRQKAFAFRVSSASKLMQPDQFRSWLAEQLASLEKPSANQGLSEVS